MSAQHRVDVAGRPGDEMRGYVGRVAVAMLVGVGAIVLAVSEPGSSGAGAPTVRLNDQNVSAVAVLGDRPGVVGTVVPGGRDPRFPMPVDLVIETPEQMAAHNDQYEAHPDWFEGASIGVAFASADPEDRAAQAAADEARAPAPKESAECARDIGAPLPGVAGRWLPCLGAGDAGSYFVLDVDVSAGGSETTLSTELGRLSERVSAEAEAAGYQNPGEGLEAVQPVVISRASGLIVVDIRDPKRQLRARTPSGSVDYLNALMSTVDQHAPGSTVEIWIDGSCSTFESWSTWGRCIATTADIQPRQE